MGLRNPKPPATPSEGNNIFAFRRAPLHSMSPSSPKLTKTRNRLLGIMTMSFELIPFSLIRDCYNRCFLWFISYSAQRPWKHIKSLFNKGIKQLLRIEPAFSKSWFAAFGRTWSVWKFCSHDRVKIARVPPSNLKFLTSFRSSEHSVPKINFNAPQLDSNNKMAPTITNTAAKLLGKRKRKTMHNFSQSHECRWLKLSLVSERSSVYGCVSIFQHDSNT